MDILQIDRCRSCKGGALDLTYHSVNDIGYEFLTFKEIFESFTGYPILDWEPQEFCKTCADTLTTLHEYKVLCQKTQETLVPMIPIKMENVDSVQEEVFSEVTEEMDDVKPDMSLFLEPSRITVPGNENMVPKVHQVIVKERNKRRRLPEQKVEITLEVYTRFYKDEQLSEKSFVGLIPFSTSIQKNLFMFRSQLWMAIRKHLIREIVFTEERKPIWADELSPNIKDMSKFVEFSYKFSSYTLDVLTNANLPKLWNGKQVILHIYPYSKSIRTKDEWIQVTTKLFEFKKRPEKKRTTKETEIEEIEKGNDLKKRRFILTKVKNIPRGVTPKMIEVSEEKTISFDSYIFNYLDESLTSARSIGLIYLEPTSTTDFKQKLWQLVNSFVIRPDLFKPGEAPFSENIDNFYDVGKFVGFRFQNSSINTFLNQISDVDLQEIRTFKNSHLYIYPYTNEVNTEEEWEKMMKKLISIDVIENRIKEVLIEKQNAAGNEGYDDSSPRIVS